MVQKRKGSSKKTSKNTKAQKYKGGVGSGISYYFQGVFFVLKNPRLWMYLVIPAIITVGFLYGVVYLGKFNYMWLEKLFSQIFWIKVVLKIPILNWFMKSFLSAIAIIIGFFCYYVVVNILLGKLNKMLSCKVEEIKTGKVIRKKSKSLKGMLAKIGDMLKSLVKSLVILLVLLAINLIPVIGQIICFIFACYSTATSYTDYVFVRRNRSDKYKRKKIKTNIRPVLSFGFMCYLSLIFPPFTLFTIPLNITAGTLLAIDMERK